MLSKNEKNYFLSVSILITGIACLVTGILLHIRPDFSITSLEYTRPLHIWVGYVLSAAIIIHVLLHSDWINSLTKRICRDKRKVVIFAGVILISLIVCCLAALYGPDSYHCKGQNKGKQKGYIYNQRGNQQQRQ